MIHGGYGSNNKTWSVIRHRSQKSSHENHE